MAEEHWFDTLNKLLTHKSPRRGVLGAAFTLAFGLRLGATDAAGKSGGKGGKKRKKAKKPNNPKPPQDPQAPDDCATTWPGKSKKQRRERNHCRFIRAQCDGDDPRDFCIVNDFEGKEGENVAVCCIELRPQCCGKNCCDANAGCCAGRCCGHSDLPEIQCCGGACIDTGINEANCGSCGNRCDAGEVCVRGNCENDCGGGSCPQGLSCCASAENGCCQSFETCCPGAGCKALLGDRENCNECGLACPLGQSCINGACGCRDGFKYCGDECDVCGRCIREEWDCCGRTSGCGPGHHCCGSGIMKFCSPQPCP